MSPTLADALASVISLAVLVLGYYVRAWISARAKTDEDRALGLALADVAEASVKSVQQTLINGKRSTLGDDLKREAKALALSTMRTLLGSAKVQRLEAEHGVKGLDVVLGAYLEAKLHDVKLSSQQLPAVVVSASAPTIPSISPDEAARLRGLAGRESQ